MANRPGRTPGANGRASIDIGGMLGAAGVGSVSGGETAAPDFAQAAGALSPEMGQAMQMNVAANTPATMMNPYATGTQGRTPYKAGFWANVASKGQAGVQAANLNAAYDNTVLAGQNQMGLQGLQNVGQAEVARINADNGYRTAELNAKNNLDVADKTGLNALSLAEKNTLMKLAEKLGVTPDYLPTAMAKINPQQAAIAEKSNVNSLGMLDMQARMQADPRYYDTYTQGEFAKNVSPIAKNMGMAQVLNPGQASFGYGSSTNPIFTLGASPESTSKTVSQNFNPETKSLSNTEITSVKSAPPRQFNLDPKGFPIVAPQNNRQAIQANPTPNPYGEVGQPEAQSSPVDPYGSPFSVRQQVNPMNNAEEVMKRNLYLRQFLGQQNTNY